jgi:hypothetical protein
MQETVCIGVVLSFKQEIPMQVDFVISTTLVIYVNVRVEVKLAKVNNVLIGIYRRHVQHVPRTATHQC